LTNDGLDVAVHLSSGEPSEEILGYAVQIGCDLIAMAIHGTWISRRISFSAASAGKYAIKRTSQCCSSGIVVEEG
jgi:nucleotide-binding universal stress UspA family protein